MAMDPAMLAHADARLTQVADSAHENFETMRKSLDNNYLLTKVGLDFLGATQVQSKEIPAGPKSV